MSGHLDINKTYHKIYNHFYWSGLNSDVSKYCKTCHTCQMVGKPNQTISKAQLQPIPAVDEPFSWILIDCVGPLPRTKSGNEYLLTIMCASTRFPEAIRFRTSKQGQSSYIFHICWSFKISSVWSRVKFYVWYIPTGYA